MSNKHTLKAPSPQPDLSMIFNRAKRRNVSATIPTLSLSDKILRVSAWTQSQGMSFHAMKTLLSDRVFIDLVKSLEEQHDQAIYRQLLSRGVGDTMSFVYSVLTAELRQQRHYGILTDETTVGDRKIFAVQLFGGESRQLYSIFFHVFGDGERATAETMNNLKMEALQMVGLPPKCVVGDTSDNANAAVKAGRLFSGIAHECTAMPFLFPFAGPDSEGLPWNLQQNVGFHVKIYQIFAWFRVWKEASLS